MESAQRRIKLTVEGHSAACASSNRGSDILGCSIGSSSDTEIGLEHHIERTAGTAHQ